ncbi:hypothetical protein Hte_010623 [Hypoxylon texense]
MDPDLDAGLFGIHLSDSEDGASSSNGAEPAEGHPPKRDAAEAPSDRTAQSEEEFQAVRKEYVVKIENGEICTLTPTRQRAKFINSILILFILQIWKNIKLPLGTGRIPKPEAQALLHAVEELYFFRRYAEGAQFVRTVLDEGHGGDGAPGLDVDTRKLLRYYETKCEEKAARRREISYDTPNT